jgi:hypothetical protein
MRIDITRPALLAAAILALAAAPLRAQVGSGHGGHAAGHGSAGDSAFAELQKRGAVHMGVDQYTSTHRFESLADGGRIELQRDTADPGDIATIRAHLRAIADAFARGDFSTPLAVHDREVPGTRVMAARRALITYTVRELPRGGEVRITTRDPEALRAVHEFLAFQRSDHRAGS